jgi:hypothetical protein
MFEMNAMTLVIIIIIIMVTFCIAGYTILRTIDEKLGSVVVNVPKHNYKLPPIYLNIDNNSNIKRVKLNDIICGENISNDESVFYNTTNPIKDIIETSTNDNSSNTLTGDYDTNIELIKKNSDKFNNYDYGTIDQSPTNGSYENFGNLTENPSYYSIKKQSLLGGKISEKNNFENNNSEYTTKKDPNYNLLTNIPLLFSPDIVSPNMKTHESYPYYSNKAKLVDKKSSQLVQLQDLYLNKINKNLNSTVNTDDFDIQNNDDNYLINGPFDGYNSNVKLQNYSYGNVTSVGKSLLTPYINYPLPIN